MYKIEERIDYLLDATKTGDYDSVKKLLDNGLNPNGKIIGESPLCVSLRRNKNNIAKLLIERGATIEKRCAGNPIMIAVEEGNCEMVEFLIKKGVSINNPDAYGRIPLHYAAILGLVDISKLLVKAGSNVDVLCEKGVSPLIYATASGDINGVKFLIKKNANVNLREDSGKTPLFFAFHEPFRCLDKNYKNLEERERKFNERELKHCEIIKTLIKSGAVFDIFDKRGMHILNYARLQLGKGYEKSIMFKLLANYIRKQRIEKMTLLFLVRKYNEHCVFSEEFLPLDLFNEIMNEAGISEEFIKLLMF